MLFNSLAFLIFIPLFMLAYWPTRGRARLWVMLLGSLVFYAWWDWRFIFLLLFSALVDYSLGILLENEREDALPGMRISTYWPARKAISLGSVSWMASRLMSCVRRSISSTRA